MASALAPRTDRQRQGLRRTLAKQLRIEALDKVSVYSADEQRWRQACDRNPRSLWRHRSASA